MPTLLLTIYWRNFNQVGAVSAMVGGLTVALVLVLLGPDVMGKDDAIWPLAIPAIVSVPAGFLFAYLGTRLGRGRVGSTGMPYDEFERRAFPQAGTREAPLHARGAGAGRGGMSAALAGDLDRDAAALSAYLEGGGEDPDGARERFLRVHADALHLELSDGRSRPLRLEELLARAAERVPGLVPAGAALEAEHARALADKQGLEIAQGLLLSFVLAAPAAGAHLVWSMLRPTAAALERLDDFRATGVADLGPAHLRREGRAGVLELRNPRHLNAEDDTTLGATEVAVDLALLDPEIEVGVFRGGVVEHPRYAGRRIFGAGINLTHLYRGRVSYLFYIVRDLGYVNKLLRGLSSEVHRPAEPEQTTEKLWIAAVETYAIGGACQLLHVVDHVIAERGARLFLPARKEGIIPGASNLRLPRAVGERLARQAILSGREFVAGTPRGRPAGRRDGRGGRGRRVRSLPASTRSRARGW